MLSVLFCGLRDAAKLSDTIGSLSLIVGKHKLSLWACALKLSTGVASVLAGNYQQGSQKLLESIKRFDAFNFKYLRPVIYCFLAEAYCGLSRFEDAFETIDLALEEITLGRDSWYEPELYRIKAQTLLQTKAEINDIENSFNMAISTAQTQASKLFEMRAIQDLAEFYKSSTL
jgi:hypothetical protein